MENRPTSYFGIVCPMMNKPKYNAETFINWLHKRMGKTGVRETARMVGVSHPTISDILGGQQPSEKTCIMLALYYEEAVEYVLQIGGHIPVRKIDGNVKLKTLINESADLSEIETEEAIDYVRFKKQSAKVKKGGTNRRIDGVGNTR